MSKVESSEEMRIREMQEQQRSAEKRSKAADAARRSERSFQETMRARSSRETGRQHRADGETRHREEGSARQILDRLRRNKKQAPHEQAKRAALSRALHGKGALEARADESLAKNLAQSDRAEQALVIRETEDGFVDRSRNDEIETDVEVREESQLEVEHEAQQAMIVAEDDRRRRGQDQDRRDHEDRPPHPHEVAKAPTARANGAAGAPAPLPPELLKRIAATLTKVVEDGRTRLRVKLRGPGLEGVELDVRAEGGEVVCEFSGCNDRLRRDLEGASTKLGSMLSRRGLRLRRLTAR